MTATTGAMRDGDLEARAVTEYSEAFALYDKLVDDDIRDDLAGATLRERVFWGLCMYEVGVIGSGRKGAADAWDVLLELEKYVPEIREA